jgi:hypothetical protein
MLVYLPAIVSKVVYACYSVHGPCTTPAVEGEKTNNKVGQNLSKLYAAHLSAPNPYHLLWAHGLVHGHGTCLHLEECALFKIHHPYFN